MKNSKSIEVDVTTCNTSNLFSEPNLSFSASKVNQLVLVRSMLLTIRLFSIFLVIYLFSINVGLAQPGQPLFQCSSHLTPAEELPALSQLACNNNLSTFLTNHSLELVPVNSPRKLKINLNIIFVQNSAGIGNFQVNNPLHLAYYNAAIAEANYKLANLQDNSTNIGGCACNTQPDFYPSTYIEIVPHYVEIQSNYYFDHMNDPVVNGIGSIYNTSRPFLREIVNIAKTKSDYASGGINWVITNHGTAVIDLLNGSQGVGHWQVPSLTEPFHGFVVADNPTFDLTRDMIIHFPDGFLRFFGFANYYAPNNDWWIYGDWVPSVGQLLAHEALHFFDLVDITGSTSCAENLMNNSGTSNPSLKVNLTGCQLRKVYTAIYAKTSRTAIVCEDALDYDLIIDQNETWSNNLRVLGDVIIKNGYTLTVTCEVHMSPKGRIIVERGGKLVVDGGKLTGGCSDRWKGIIVEGDALGLQAQSGVVELKNSAIIERAVDAISMNPSHLTWSNTYGNYFGGIIRAENSTIRQCRRGVEFMKYGFGGFKDVSYFKDVLFEELHEGVTNWADDGVTFDHCTFKNITRRGIHPYDSEVIVKNGTEFSGMPIGIDAISTYPIIFSSKIGLSDPTLQRNEFKCQFYGVYAQSGGNSEELSIQRNDFSQSTVGFQQDGNGQFKVQYNNFSNPSNGVRLYDCGVNTNLVEINRFSSSYIGANSNKVNTGLRYLGNCFQNNSMVDINNQNGNIFPFQGDALSGAGNCFEGFAVQINNKTGTGNLFYFVKQGTPTTSCKFPKNGSFYNFTVLDASDDFYSSCNDFPFLVSDDICNIPTDASIATLGGIREQIQTQLNGLQVQYPSGRWEYMYWNENYRSCLQKIDDLIGQKYLSPNTGDPFINKEAAIAYFNGCGDFMNRSTAYGIMVAFGEYNRARTYLQNMPVGDEGQSNFKWVQGINLDYLQNRQLYSLAESDRLRLNQIGRSDGPYNGYARALYEVLTGDRIEVNFADLDLDSKDRTHEEFTDAEILSVSTFPNPVRNGQLNVLVSGVKTVGTLRCTLSDVSGRQILTQPISSDGTFIFDVSSVPNGIFFLKVFSPNEDTQYQTRIVILN